MKPIFPFSEYKKHQEKIELRKKCSEVAHRFVLGTATLDDYKMLFEHEKIISEQIKNKKMLRMLVNASKKK